MRREDKIKSTPGRRKKSETEKSNRDFLFSHLNQGKKTNSTKKTKSHNLTSNSTRTESSRSKSFTIESILARQDPPKQRLSTVDILSNLVNEIPVDDSEDENCEQQTCSSASLRTSSPSSNSQSSVVESQASISTSGQPRNPNSVTRCTSYYNTPVCHVRESSRNIGSSTATLPKEKCYENTVESQSSKSTIERTSTDRIHNALERTNSGGFFQRVSRQNESSVPPSLILVTNRSRVRDEVSKRAGNHSNYVSSPINENIQSKRNSNIPEHSERTLRLEGRENNSRIQELSRNSVQERASVIRPTQANSFGDISSTGKSRSLVVNYDQHDSEIEVDNHFLRSSRNSEAEVSQRRSINDNPAVSDTSTFDHGKQCNDFETFRRTSILTLRNRAEKHVMRLNVCS